MVDREESLLHEQMLQVLVVHRDFSHHVTWHITREPTRGAVIETVRVFVSNHLINAEAAQLVTSSWVLYEKKIISFCLLLERDSHHLVGDGNRKLKAVHAHTQVGTGNTAHCCQQTTEMFYLQML